jgi:hypothetical protein
MSTSDSSNCYQSLNFLEALDKKLLETEKYVSMKRNFIEFQNWSSENNSVVLGDGINRDDILIENELSRNDEELVDELAQLFSSDKIFDEEELVDELDRLEEYLANSQTVLVACPENMPRWENAWWGERILRALS